MLNILLEIESIVNKLPITYVYPDDCVTPNHLLYGRKLSFTIPKPAISTQSTRPECDRVAKMIQHFWERWRQRWSPRV